MAIKINEEAADRLHVDLPGSLSEMMEVYDWEIYCADGDDELDQYEHLRRGNCMLCGESLGEDTIIMVDKEGILGMFCGTDCCQDLHIIPYLNAQLEEKLERLMPEEE